MQLGSCGRQGHNPSLMWLTRGEDVQTGVGVRDTEWLPVSMPKGL